MHRPTTRQPASYLLPTSFGPAITAIRLAIRLHCMVPAVLLPAPHALPPSPRPAPRPARLARPPTAQHSCHPPPAQPSVEGLFSPLNHLTPSLFPLPFFPRGASIPKHSPAAQPHAAPPARCHQGGRSNPAPYLLPSKQVWVFFLFSSPRTVLSCAQSRRDCARVLAPDCMQHTAYRTASSRPPWGEDHPAIVLPAGAKRLKACVYQCTAPLPRPVSHPHGVIGWDSTHTYASNNAGASGPYSDSLLGGA